MCIRDRDYSEYQDKYDSLKADAKRLDRLFEKTCYAKAVSYTHLRRKLRRKEHMKQKLKRVMAGFMAMLLSLIHI